MSDFDWEQPDEFGGDAFLNAPGTYHMTILDVKTEDKDGAMIEGFRVDMAVLDGTQKDQRDKKFSATLFNGKSSQKDGGRFARQRQAAMFVASGIIGPEHIPMLLEKKLRGIDLPKMKGRQLVVTLGEQEYNDKKTNEKKKSLNILGQSIFHVDDPNAAAFPKDMKAISILPKSLRRTAQQLEAIKDAFGRKKTDPSKPAPVSPPDDAGTVSQDLTADL